MKPTKALNKMLSKAMDIGRRTHTEIIEACFVEAALTSEKESLFRDNFSEKHLDGIVDAIKEEIRNSKKIDSRIVENYAELGKELPVRKGLSYVELLRVSVGMAEGSPWHTGEVEISHMLMAIMAMGSVAGSPMINYIGENNLEENLESVLKAIITEEGEIYGIKPDFKKIFSPMEQKVGLPMQQEDDWHDYVTDLVEKVKEYKKPFVGREDVIESSIRILSRMDKSNPVYVGEPGVGKTAITYGLARKIHEGNVPDKLKNASLFSVDLAGMLAGAKYRGEFEQRLKNLLEGVVNENENPILFFDEIHTIVGAGTSADSSLDASNIIKPFLTEGNIKFIGATTYDEYRQYIEKDKALERRFQKVVVEEPSIEDAITIIDGLREAYEKYHDVKYDKKAIEAAVKMSVKYINDRFLPDKAIDLIDEAGANAQIHPEFGKKITEKSIEEVLTKICKIPKVEADKNEMKVLRGLNKNLEANVFGQDEAIKQITDAIKLSKSGLADEDKPIGSFLFVGPSGVGKTELAKQLAKELDVEFIRFDMSEYQEKHSVSKLIGAPAGYVGYEDGGVLVERIRKSPHCVLLFDEIEKAHPDIFKTFLQIMDYGKLTDNKGRKADFRNCVIIMTSNEGATVANKSIGFCGANDESKVNVDGIMGAVNNLFAPEFRNRLTKTIVFNGLDSRVGKLVVNKELKLLNNKLKAKKINATFTDACIDELVKRGVSKEYGAREIQRVINENIKNMFVKAIVDEMKLDNCTVDFNGTEFSLKTKRTNKSLDFKL